MADNSILSSMSKVAGDVVPQIGEYQHDAALPRVTPEILEDLRKNGMLTTDVVRKMDQRDQHTAFQMMAPDEQKRFVQSAPVTSDTLTPPGIVKGVFNTAQTMGTNVGRGIGALASGKGFLSAIGHLLGGGTEAAETASPTPEGAPRVSRAPMPTEPPPPQPQPVQTGFGFHDMEGGHSNSPMPTPQAPPADKYPMNIEASGGGSNMPDHPPNLQIKGNLTSPGPDAKPGPSVRRAQPPTPPPPSNGGNLEHVTTDQPSLTGGVRVSGGGSESSTKPPTINVKRKPFDPNDTSGDIYEPKDKVLGNVAPYLDDDYNKLLASTPSKDVRRRK